MRYKYIGTINNVNVKGKGIVKRGDIVEFNNNENVSPENWEKLAIIKAKRETFESIKTQQSNNYKKPKRKVTRKKEEFDNE